MPMLIILVLLLFYCGRLCATVSASEGTIVHRENPFMAIDPISYTREYGQYVVKRVQDTLNLTCTVYDNSTEMEIYNITWSVPSGSTNSQNRVAIQKLTVNTMNLVVPHLEARDEGEYTCRAEPIGLYPRHHDILTSAVIVNIKSKKKICGDTMFTCNISKLQNCIHKRYKCDGYNDCQMGEDEDIELCGESPCQDKLQCEDSRNPVVRCIPKHWCCNPRMDPNCTVKEPLSCCPESIKPFMDDRSFYSTHPDINLIQTTIYTIIGCAMVFMIVVTVLVIAICRVQMKRTLMTQFPANVQHSHRPVQPTQNIPLYDLDVHLNRGCTLESLPPPGFLVTYNINNGVQIVGHAIDPPPYCEVISVPPREGPPPPYTSHETLDEPETQALLQPSSISQTECRSLRLDSDCLRRTGSDHSFDTATPAYRS